LQTEAMQFALSAPGVMSAALVSGSVFVLVALATARLLGRDVRAQLRLQPTRASAAGIFGAVLGVAGLSLASGAATDLLGLRQQGTMEDIARALTHSSPARLLLALVTIAIAPAIAEETFFRGLLQTRLVARWGRWPGIVIASIAFGIIHLDPVQGPLAFLVGLFLGWVTERFGGIRPSVAAHAINNAIFVLAASLTSTGGDGSRAGDYAAVAAGGVACLAATTLLRSRFAVR
jgi:membrane protease YdiL (CAAX protease family)